MITIVRSKYTPQVTQTEDVNLMELTIQFLGFFIWAAIWLCAAYSGTEPIMPEVVQADEVTSFFHEVADQGSAYFVTYALLFGCVAVHNTINIMLAHTSRMKYQPFNKLYLFASFALTAMALIAATPGQQSINMSTACFWLFVVVAGLQWTWIMVLIREVTQILDISVFLTKQSVERRRQ